MRHSLSATAIIACILALYAPAAVEAAFLNFDDGTQNAPIDAYYAGSGVTFSNTRWVNALLPPFNGINHHLGASLPYVLYAITTVTGSGGHIDEPHAIVAMFTPAVSSVTIRAIDVGASGVRIKAYDSLVGGTLLDTDTFIGTGFGTGVFPDLTVAAPGIRRVEMFQPVQGLTDGTAFDNLAYTPETAIGVDTVTWGAIKALYGAR
jgi:hypothetical protein